ncbi:oxidoreductase [candidate division KSB1 bacterium]|nr:oxidoreductase [candidate division KSB1 bacterium]
MQIVLFMLLFPVLGAVAAGLSRRKWIDIFAVAAVTGMLACLILLLLQISPGEAARSVPITLSWLTQTDIGGLFGYQLDAYNILLLSIVVVLGFLVVLYGTAYIGKRNKEHPSEQGKARHHFWMLMFIVSMIGIAISPNLLQLYIFWELTTLTSYALISHYRNGESLRAGFKALIMTFSGGIFFAIALIIIFVHTNSFEFSAIGLLSPKLRFWIFLFFLIAAWAKSAQVPFYTWLPDAMAAPTTVSMYLHAAAMVKAGVYLIARLALANEALSHTSGLIVGIMAVVTMLVALYLFFYQDDLKRLLAYSTIAHLAYVLFGAALGIMGSKLGLFAGIMHIMNHSVGKGLLFLVVGAIAYTTGTRSIKDLSGLARSAPLIGAAFIVGMLAILGIPPFSGFWSKFYLLTATVQLGGKIGILMLIPFVAEIIIAFAWFLHVGHKVFFGPVSAAAKDASDPPWRMSFALIVLMILTLVAPFVALHLAHILGM